MDAYTAALRILSYRFNSEGELRRKLRAKEFAKDEIDAAIERLRKEKWLDDERFAASFVRTRARRRVGRLRIARELGAAGVDGDTISAAITQNVEPEDERAAAEELAGKKMATLLRRYERDAARDKVAAYLQRQGYELGMVLEIVRKL